MRLFLILLFSLLLYTCKSDSDTNLSHNKNPIINKIKSNEDKEFISKVKKIKLHSEAIKAVEKWNDYQNIAEFIPKFYKTSTKEILSNANQFYKLSSYLKDSLKIKQFKTASVKIRINVLNNEALRLFDMDSIPSITSDEVIIETKRIINAFNALNIKINNDVKKELLTSEVAEFDHLFNVNKDSLSIKSINNKEKRNRKKGISPLNNKATNNREKRIIHRTNKTKNKRQEEILKQKKTSSINNKITKKELLQNRFKSKKIRK